MALAAVVMALAACAGLDEPASGAPPGEPTEPGAVADPSADPVTVPGDAGVPLLRLHSAGGYLPLGWDFARVPDLTVYPDGQVIAHGPQTAIYPPPVLPNLVLRDLAEADVDALVAAARDAGLLDEVAPEYGSPSVADAGTTFLRLHVDGRTVEHAAEALSIVDGIDGWTPGPGADLEGTEQPEQPPEAPSPESAQAWNLSEEQLGARATLAGFIARAHEVVGAAAEVGPYAMERFAVMARPAPAPEPGATGTDEGVDEGDPVPQVLPWPLAMPLAEAEDCVLVDGEDARTLHDVLLPAAFTVQFEQAGVRYDAFFRPLLPHEADCDDL